MTDLRALANPFPASDVEWRLQQAGERNGKVWARVLAYITNRAIMQRLDDVCGPENWRNEYRHEANGAVMCGISIRVAHLAQIDGASGAPEWVTKWDGAENTDIEAVKGGLSNAMKRAAVQWGIGRYLYELEEGFAVVSDNGANYAAKKDGKYPAFKWDPPRLPAWALPGGSGKAALAAGNSSSNGTRRASSEDGGKQPPTTPSANAPATAEKRPEDMVFRNHKLGDYLSSELRTFITESNNAAFKKACQHVLTARAARAAEEALGTTDDAKVERMKAGVVADQADLKF